MLDNRSVPRSTVIPELVYPDVERAVRWLCDTFAFRLRIGMGSHRVQLNVGDGAVVLMGPRGDGESHGYVMVRVEDVRSQDFHSIDCGYSPSGFGRHGERALGVSSLI